MAIVKCHIHEIELDGDYDSVASTEVECSKCGHTTNSYGTEQNSIKRCLWLLSDECPRNERNYYVGDYSSSDVVM